MSAFSSNSTNSHDTPPWQDPTGSDPLETNLNLSASSSLDPERLQQLSEAVQQLAVACQGDCLALLALLRELERRHQIIRESLFIEALPDNRQKLYGLLKDIEVSGGWPYIKRMKLVELLALLESNEEFETKDGQSRDQGLS